MSDPQTIDLRWLDVPKPYLVPVPRVPCVEERFIGPDDVPPLLVTRVSFVYERGFYFPPSVVVDTAEERE